jgi:hypothetical protein
MGGRPMRKFISLFLVFAFLIGSAGFAGEKVIVPGNPPITMKAVFCHMRLIEFVLETRLTVAQKDRFLDAIKKECAQMPEQDRNNFLSACELVDSMALMEPAGHEAVKFVLKQDFESSAKSLPDDPAAVLYLELQQKAASEAVKVKDHIITRQSLAAFIEYLEFIANPENPQKFSEKTASAVKKSLADNILKLGEAEQAVLDDFQLTWFMIRAGWQKMTDQARKAALKKSFKDIGLNEYNAFELTKLSRVLSSETYADLLDEAARQGIEPAGWSADSSADLW